MDDIQLLAVDIFSRFYNFSDGVRVMMLIDRSIGNTNKGTKRWVNKLISTNPEEFCDNLVSLLRLQHFLNDPNIRLYTCVNHRHFKKAVKYFLHKIIDINSDAEELRFFSNIKNKFCSALMKPENRQNKLFLLDIDTKDTQLIDTFFAEPILKYETVKGWHYIVNPFDPRTISHIQHCEVKKDGLLLLHYLKK